MKGKLAVIIEMNGIGRWGRAGIFSGTATYRTAFDVTAEMLGEADDRKFELSPGKG